MDNYEVFWDNEIASEGYLQLVLDWDVFIRNFAASIATYAHYDLNTIQREFIRDNVMPRLTLLTKSTPQRLTITCTYISSRTRMSKKYEHREDVLYDIDEKGY
jgi:hypothetical protein